MSNTNNQIQPIETVDRYNNVTVSYHTTEVKQVLAKQLPTRLNPYLPTNGEKQRFIDFVLQRCQEQPEILTCEPNSVINTLISIAASKIEPTLDHVILLSRDIKNTENKKVRTLTAQFTAEGKKRAINLLTNGKYIVESNVVRKNDTFVARGFPRQIIEHEPSFGDESTNPIVSAYAVMLRVADSKQMTMVEMSRTDIEHIMSEYSDSFKKGKKGNYNKSTGKYDYDENDKSDSIWSKEFSEMCIKTIIGRLHKRIKANMTSYIDDVPGNQDEVVERDDSQTLPNDFTEKLESAVDTANLASPDETIDCIDVDTPTVGIVDAKEYKSSNPNENQSN